MHLVERFPSRSEEVVGMNFRHISWLPDSTGGMCTWGNCHSITGIVEQEDHDLRLFKINGYHWQQKVYFADLVDTELSPPAARPQS